MAESDKPGPESLPPFSLREATGTTAPPSAASAFAASFGVPSLPPGYSVPIFDATQHPSMLSFPPASGAPSVTLAPGSTVRVEPPAASVGAQVVSVFPDLVAIIVIGWLIAQGTIPAMAGVPFILAIINGRSEPMPLGRRAVSGLLAWVPAGFRPSVGQWAGGATGAPGGAPPPVAPPK